LFSTIIILSVVLVNIVFFYSITKYSIVYDSLIKVLKFMFNIINIDALTVYNNTDVLSIIELVTKGIGVFISVSLTLLFFTYRHRISISLSDRMISRKTNQFDFIIIISTLSFGQLILMTVSSNEN